MTFVDAIPHPLLDDIIKGRSVPVLGAGFSRNAILPPGKQMPLWSDIGQELAKEVPDYVYSTPIDAVSAYSHEYSRSKLIEALSSLLLIETAQPGPAHLAFCRLPFDVVCTTNFDFLLERGYEQQPRAIYCRPVVDQEQLAISIGEPGVLLLKLHGDLNHPNRLVVTEEDYSTFLDRYPLMATYLANLLITRTPIFVGYSLEDPDFRQIWEIIGNRLGSTRRTAYTLLVGARPADVARFARRGVKVVNLPGSKQEYTEILERFFTELKSVWSQRLIEASAITGEEVLGELLLPKEATTRLCYFAIPQDLYSFYKSLVFPLAEEQGLVPITAEDVISPGDTVTAKISALLERAQILVADASSPTTFYEIDRAASRLGDPPKMLIIIEEGAKLPFIPDIGTVLRRPVDLAEVPEEFLANLESWFRTMSESLVQRFSEEPQRLLEVREYRAAVVAAVTLLEATLSEVLRTVDIPFPKEKKKRPPLYHMLGIAGEHHLLGDDQVSRLRRWMTLRNRVVHTDVRVTRREAQEAVADIVQIVSLLRDGL